MSRSRSPSPHPGGGWSSPGLTPGSGSSTPRSILSPRLPGPGGISWAAAKAKSDRVRSYPSFSTRNNGFFSRQKRMISSSLPRFRAREYMDKDDDYAFRRGGNGTRFRTFFGSMLRRRRLRLLLIFVIMFIGYLFFWNGECLLPPLCLHGDGFLTCASYCGSLSSISIGQRPQVCADSRFQC